MILPLISYNVTELFLISFALGYMKLNYCISNVVFRKTKDKIVNNTVNPLIRMKQLLFSFKK